MLVCRMLYACMLICLHALLYACRLVCSVVCLYAYMLGWFFCVLLCLYAFVFCCMLGMRVSPVVCLYACVFCCMLGMRCVRVTFFPTIGDEQRLISTFHPQDCSATNQKCVSQPIALARSLDSNVAILPQFCSCFGNESLL